MLDIQLHREILLHFIIMLLFINASTQYMYNTQYIIHVHSFTCEKKITLYIIILMYVGFRRNDLYIIFFTPSITRTRGARSSYYYYYTKMLLSYYYFLLFFFLAVPKKFE